MRISEGTSLEDMLRIYTETWPSDARNRSLQAYVYENGRSFTAAPLPTEIKQGMIKMCFDNSVSVFKRHGLTYVEGYAILSKITGMPIHHAWNVTPDGTVVDSTWVPEGLEYYGIEVENEMVEANRDSWMTPLGILV